MAEINMSFTRKEVFNALVKSELWEGWIETKDEISNPDECCVSFSFELTENDNEDDEDNEEGDGDNNNDPNIPSIEELELAYSE